KGMKGEINHKTVAAIAGLGGIGSNLLLITPGFGPFVRLSTIVTDAPLGSDQPLDENPCDNCDLCRTACPVNAIKEDGTFDYRACASYILRNGLPGIIAIAKKLIEADEKAIKEIIYSPDFWEIWQSTVSGSFYGCFECIRSNSHILCIPNPALHQGPVIKRSEKKGKNENQDIYRVGHGVGYSFRLWYTSKRDGSRKTNSRENRSRKRCPGF
ncbi:MAG: epoxyqueuosine reductase, partial [Deltaproteobacteria bacterium]|nr:epoxyqueuosine reductase [Deltaproteobacteria bacterium]